MLSMFPLTQKQNIKKSHYDSYTYVVNCQKMEHYETRINNLQLYKAGMMVK